LGELILKRQSTTRRTLERVVAVPVQTYAEYSGFQFTSVDQVDIVGVPESVPFLLAGDSGSVIVSRQKILLLTLIWSKRYSLQEEQPMMESITPWELQLQK